MYGYFLEAESQAEMGRLLRGEDPELLLNECTFCFGCTHYCPHGLKPYAIGHGTLGDEYPVPLEKGADAQVARFIKKSNHHFRKGDR